MTSRTRLNLIKCTAPKYKIPSIMWSQADKRSKLEHFLTFTAFVMTKSPFFPQNWIFGRKYGGDDVDGQSLWRKNFAFRRAHPSGIIERPVQNLFGNICSWKRKVMLWAWKNASTSQSRLKRIQEWQEIMIDAQICHLVLRGLQLCHARALLKYLENSSFSTSWLESIFWPLSKISSKYSWR